jgi:uncharacterized phage protein (TIGR02218 family)
MTTFFDDESGIETSRPREFILFETPAQTLGVALGTRDIVEDGRTYFAIPSLRGEISCELAGDDSDLIISLPVTHAIPQRWMRDGVPPMYVRVTVYRKQLPSAETEIVWRGKVESMTISVDDIAALRVPSQLIVDHSRRLPQISVGKLCPHILYDANCKADRNGSTPGGQPYLRITTVAVINGRKITVDDIGLHGDDWFTGGEILHVASGERMTVSSQIGRLITMQLPIPGMGLGDEVHVFAGCDHVITTGCQQKFNNQLNFGGFPGLPIDNPSTPNTLGILVTDVP